MPPELPDPDEDSWVNTPFEPFKLPGKHDHPTPTEPILPVKAWQCTYCKTWQLDGDPCSKCGRRAG
jgi:hypothetical protein